MRGLPEMANPAETAGFPGDPALFTSTSSRADPLRRSATSIW
jgi:hypothetical protein